MPRHSTPFLYVGLMSGTSADAIDAALVQFEGNTTTIVSTYNLPLPDSVRHEVHSLALSGHDEIDRIRKLDTVIASLSSEAVNNLCIQSNTPKQAINAIGSHGQTIRHYPPSPTQNGYSLQVGDPNLIAEQTGITTIADFRRRDLAAGGQGAPLAPAFHNAVFHSAHEDRFIVNIGGVSNITHLPRSAKPIGFDTGPGNNLMDSWFNKHCGGSFDTDGNWAQTGIADEDLLAQLNRHSFLHLPPPKSTGREAFNLPWLEQQLIQLGKSLTPQDVQASLLVFTAQNITKDIESIDPSQRASVFICGGGAHNNALMNTLSDQLRPRELKTTGALGILPDWVEAAAFAWLAKQTQAAASGNLPAVTGARHPAILGGIYLA